MAETENFRLEVIWSLLICSDYSQSSRNACDEYRLTYYNEWFHEDQYVHDPIGDGAS